MRTGHAISVVTAAIVTTFLILHIPGGCPNSEGLPAFLSESRDGDPAPADAGVATDDGGGASSDTTPTDGDAAIAESLDSGSTDAASISPVPGRADEVTDSSGMTDEAGKTDAGGDDDGIQSGTLTAGSFDDNLNFDNFQSFVTDVLQSDTTGELPNLPLGQRILITIQDENGDPVLDARVVVTPTAADAQEQPPVALDQTTGTDGRVLFLTALDDGSNSTTYTLTVHPPNGSNPVTETRSTTNLHWEVTLAGEVASVPDHLDLAFVIDTTGSMSDELEYLQIEVRDIARAVGDTFPEVTQRYALILYRDNGDAYVMRDFDFTDSLDDFVANLEAQSAAGGGDWPEAMHLALEAAGELSWTSPNTARVLFLIADAPPHTEHAAATLAAIQALRDATIAVYPVAASGVGERLEFYARTMAMLTLSEYIFLTDDSGVGNSHAEPHFPCYHVQRLDQVILRMIQAELTGTRIEPDEANIIRTVGNPVDGVCAEEQQDGQDQGQDQQQ